MTDGVEVVPTVLLALAAVATAWCSFQATRSKASSEWLDAYAHFAASAPGERRCLGQRHVQFDRRPAK